jgi:hypothetical protein
VFAFHRAETLAEWLAQAAADAFKERRAALEATFKDPAHDCHLGDHAGAAVDEAT